MKVTVKEKESDITYPCLMTSGAEHVVFFTERGKGASLNGNQIHKIGEYREDWFMPSFRPFTGTITLSND